MMTRHRPCHIHNRPFTRRVQQMRRPASQSRHTRHVDDRAAVALFGGVEYHVGNAVFRHDDHGGDVDFHPRGPFGHVDRDGGAARAADADDVDEDVDAVVEADDLVDGGFDGGFGGHVAGHGDGGAVAGGFNH
jgi:hypothetical protein